MPSYMQLLGIVDDDQDSNGSWEMEETERLLLRDSNDLNKIGFGIDDLVKAYMQVALGNH